MNIKILKFILCFSFLIKISLFVSCRDKDITNKNSSSEQVLEKSEVDVYLTKANKSKLFSKEPLMFDTKDNMSPYTIRLFPDVTYQEIDGFGAAFTGSTCYNLMQMPADKRQELLEETFDPIKGIGYSYIRIPIGCSDFSLSEYTYCDEPGIENFSFQEEEQKYIFPILKHCCPIKLG